MAAYRFLTAIAIPVVCALVLAGCNDSGPAIHPDPHNAASAGAGAGSGSVADNGGGGRDTGGDHTGGADSGDHGAGAGTADSGGDGNNSGSGGAGDTGAKDNQGGDSAQPPGALRGVRPVVTVRGRLEPVQGESALLDPPLRHGDPAANEGDFVDRDTGETVQQFDDLGAFEVGAPSPRVTRNELMAGADTPAPDDPARVYWLLHMADMQVVDEQSPGLIPASKFAVPTVTAAAYRPQNPYIVQNAEAMVQAAARLQAETADYDLAVHTGDAVENAQRNELGWFLAILDGGRVAPDSGARNDLIPGPNNDPQDPFDAPGLNAPWLSTIGNHDLEAIGNLPPVLIRFINDPVRLNFIAQSFGALGLSIPNVPTGAERRDRLSPPQIDLRSDAGLAGLNAPITLDSLLSRSELTQAFDRYFNDGNLDPKSVPADPKRAALDTCAFVDAHLAAPGLPTGHGFTQAFNGDNGNGQCTGDYSYTPPNAPWLRVISLATGYPYGGDQGVVGRAQTPPNPQALMANSGVDADVSDTFSTPKNSAQGQPLQRPGAGRRLFDVPAFQGLAEPEANGDPRRDSVAFLDEQLQRAQDAQQLVIVISHHRSTDLTATADLRVFLETSICDAVSAAAVLVDADCDASDASLSTGDVGAPVDGRDAAGNTQALDFFARLITQNSAQTYANLTQAEVDAGAAFIDGVRPGASGQLADAFETLFALRALMPDPVDALTPEAFRRKLAANPNVIVHLAGHEHKLRVAAVCGDATLIPADDPDNDAADNGRTCDTAGAKPGSGYYEIVTAGSLELSKEWRLEELVDNNNGTLTVYASTFGAQGGRLNDAGIKLAFADALTGGLDITPGDGIDDHQDQPGDVNVKLTVPILPAIDRRLDDVATRSATILTTSAAALRPKRPGAR